MRTQDEPGERCTQAATDEVDDLELIAFLQLSLPPPVSGHDVAVQLDGQTVGLHAEGLEERREGKGRGGSIEGSRFTIDVKFHFGI